MSDAPAPSGATATSAQMPAAGPPPSTNGASGHVTPDKGAPRANDGRFLPKESNQHPPTKPLQEPIPKEPPKANAPPEKEPYRFKRKLKVYGEEQDVDFDEEELTRELQKGRAALRQASEFKKGREAAARILELAKQDPDAFLKETGRDPQEWARQRLAQLAKLETMSEHERQAFELSQEVERLRGELTARTEREQAAQKAALVERAKQQNVLRYREALKHMDLPEEYESIYLMAETERLAVEDGQSYTPEELAKETARRLDTYTERWLKARGKTGAPALVASLKQMGLLEAVLESVVSEHLKTQGVAPAQKPAPPPPVVEPEGRLTEREVNERLRAMRQAR